MNGKGLIKGLKVTICKFFKKKITQKYPEVMPRLPSRSQGSFTFASEKCTSCNLCADSCPNGVIRVKYFKDAKGKRLLEDYSLNMTYCLFCGLCVHACPTGAINFKTDFELTCFKKENTVLKWAGSCQKEDDASWNDTALKMASAE